jgi:hypothetical protein
MGSTLQRHPFSGLVASAISTPSYNVNNVNVNVNVNDDANATQRNATQRNATQRNATQRNATQRNATQRNVNDNADATATATLTATATATLPATPMLPTLYIYDIIIYATDGLCPTDTPPNFSFIIFILLLAY